MANVQGDKYSCQNLVIDEIEYYHVTRLRELRYDERYVGPRDIALRDRDEFYVEKILAHHGDTGRLKTLSFHVKWRGFDESFNSWEPWKNLRSLVNPSWFAEVDSSKVSRAIPRTCGGTSSASIECVG